MRASAVVRNSIAILAIIVTGIFWVGLAAAQTQWKKYPGNPLGGIELGAPGEWDDTEIGWPYILHINGEYRMWYNGRDDIDGHWQIGYATSRDGIHWKKHPSNPVVSLGASGSYDDHHVAAPCVIFDPTGDIRYRMWYDGYDRGAVWRLCYATSSDGINWHKYGLNPVWDIGNCDAHYPRIIYNGSIYKMWYCYCNLPNTRTICYADSVNGVDWHPRQCPVLEPGPPGSWDDEHIYWHFVHYDYDGTKYEMWYTGYDGLNKRIGYATSPDGLEWKKHNEDEQGNSDYVLDIGPESWEDTFVEGPSVLLEGKCKYKMWYTGDRTAIGYAYSKTWPAIYDQVFQRAESETALPYLRAYRDDVLASDQTGSKLVDELYERHSEELARILLTHPKLTQRGALLIRRYLPGIRKILKGEEMEITRLQLAQIGLLLDDIARVGSLRLKAYIESVQKVLGSKEALAGLGIKVAGRLRAAPGKGDLTTTWGAMKHSVQEQ